MSLPPDYNPMQEQSRLNQDAEFNEHMKRLLKHFKDIPEQRLRMFAGMPCDAGGINDTPLKCLRAAIPPYMPLPEGLEQKLAGRVVKRAPGPATDDAFKQAWAQYVSACQARKQRIAEAQALHKVRLQGMRARHAAELSALQENQRAEIALLDRDVEQALAEPVPEAPKRAAL